MKKIPLISLVAVFTLVAALPVFAASEDSLQIRVSTPLVAVSLSEDLVDFGTLDLGEEKESSVYPVVKNEGSVIVDLEMKGTNASYGSSTWVLSDVDNGDDQYMLMISKTSSWTTGVINLSTDYKDFLDSLATTADQSFHIKILMPKTTSAYGEYTANIYVRATQTGT